MFLERLRYLATMHVCTSCKGSFIIALILRRWYVLFSCILRFIKRFKKSNGPKLLIPQHLKKLYFCFENFERFFFRCSWKDWDISLVCIFSGVAEEVCALQWLRVAGKFHSVPIFGSINDFQKPTGGNYWLLRIIKSWIFESKIFKSFFSDVLGKIEISHYYAYLYEFKRQCVLWSSSAQMVCSIFLCFPVH